MIFLTHSLLKRTSIPEIVVCYYGTWATYRSGNGKFDVSNIDTSLCTHVVYTFVGIDNDGYVISLDPYLDLPDNWGRDNFGAFNALKEKNANLKTILAVGGWNEGSAKYSTMAASPTLRKNFITSAKQMLLTHGFDGLDVDWEYPSQRDSTHGSADVNNFSVLLKELREEFDKNGLMITVAVAAVKQSASRSYDIATMSQYVDIVSIMAYDMYGAWDAVTGHNAPLHKGEGDENLSKDDVYSVDVTLDYWLSQGCPPSKLVLGLPLYGRTFTLTNANVNGVRAPASGAGIAGQFTVTNGLIGYNEFCKRLQTETWDVRYDSLAKVPYAVQGRNWVSYDDPNSLTQKVEYAMNLGIAGAMVWSIETDDFHGICGEKFALLKAINSALDGSAATESPSASTTAASTTAFTTISSTSTIGVTVPVTSTTTTTTTESSHSSTPSSSVCTQEGLTSNPDDCSSFFMCIRGTDGTLEPKLFNCPDTLLWDNTYKLCNYEDLVQCA
ncbi:chitinase-3-like protein 1 [Choristoneura fumiferana]|uniref:chitinase-3-like protein 1 n=1 Tax=Choristoneura fumiferana TaxID=7141 RepID=UPI003D15611B